MRKIDRLADRLLMAGQRMAYRNFHGEKRGEPHYEYNLKNIEELKRMLEDCVEDGSWSEQYEAEEGEGK